MIILKDFLIGGSILSTTRCNKKLKIVVLARRGLKMGNALTILVNPAEDGGAATRGR